MRRPKARYTTSEVDCIQKRVIKRKSAFQKARKLMRQAECALVQTKQQLNKATRRYEEAKAELEVIGIKVTAKGFAVDTDGYVVPQAWQERNGSI